MVRADPFGRLSIRLHPAPSPPPCPPTLQPSTPFETRRLVIPPLHLSLPPPTRLADPYAAEGEIHGILADCGCGTATPCGSGAACMAYGRLMAFALFGLGLVRATCAVARGRGVWFMGLLIHGGWLVYKQPIAFGSPPPNHLPSPPLLVLHPQHSTTTTNTIVTNKNISQTSLANTPHLIPIPQSLMQWPRVRSGGARLTRWRFRGSRRCPPRCNASVRC